MTLTSEFINHKRLGDLVIPGSHNAGSYGCNASDFTLVKKKAVFVTIEDIVPQVNLINFFQNVKFDRYSMARFLMSSNGSSLDLVS